MPIRRDAPLLKCANGNGVVGYCRSECTESCTLDLQNLLIKQNADDQ